MEKSFCLFMGNLRYNYYRKENPIKQWYRKLKFMKAYGDLVKDGQFYGLCPDFNTGITIITFLTEHGQKSIPVKPYEWEFLHPDILDDADDLIARVKGWEMYSMEEELMEEMEMVLCS